MSQKCGVEHHLFKMPVNYEWLRFVATDSAIKRKDILVIFDISAAGLDERIKAGNFPRPDFIREGGKGYNKPIFQSDPSYWKKETVVNEIRRLQKKLHESTQGK